MWRLPSVPRGVPRFSARARARKRRERGRNSYLETLGAARATRGEKFLEAGPLAALRRGRGRGDHGQRERPHTKFSDDGCRRFGRVGVESGSSASRRKETGRDRGETTRAAGAPEESNREGAWTGSAAPPRRRRAATLAAPNSTEKRHAGTGRPKIFGWARRVGRRAHQAVTDGFVRGLNILDGGALADLLASTHVEQGRLCAARRRARWKWCWFLAQPRSCPAPSGLSAQVAHLTWAPGGCKPRRDPMRE